MSIYIANSFFDAIGNIGRPSEGGDRWTIPGGKKLSGFRRWDKESAFFDPGMPGPDTANTLMSSFLALYATKNKFRSPDNRSKKNSDKTLKDLLVNLIPEEIFKDIPSWKKRNQVPRPYDAVDNECFDMDEEDDE